MNAQVNEETVQSKPAVERVKMTDGREVEFVGKRKLLKETIIGEDGSVAIRMDFRNGETRTYPIPDSLKLKFAGHGAEQKYGDETAGVEDIDDMVLATDELHSRIEKGEWSTKREGSGVAGTSVLLRALVEWSKRTPEQVKTFLAGKTQAEKLALRNHPELKVVIERLESEKASKASKIDTEALLAAL